MHSPITPGLPFRTIDFQVSLLRLVLQDPWLMVERSVETQKNPERSTVSSTCCHPFQLRLPGGMELTLIPEAPEPN